MAQAMSRFVSVASQDFGTLGRYLEEAAHLDQSVEVSEATVPMTLKLPAGTVRLLRAHAEAVG
jgi:hypothetical protein